MNQLSPPRSELTILLFAAFILATLSYSYAANSSLEKILSISVGDLQKNLTHLVINSQKTHPKENVSTKPDSENTVFIKIRNEFDFYFFASIILAGAATGLGIILGDRMIHQIVKPKISVRCFQPVLLRTIGILLYSIDDVNIPSYYRTFSVKYTANRVVVLNNGGTAAENSKGALRVKTTKNGNMEEEELKLRWIPVLEQYKMTINAHSEEYLDVCGVCEDDPAKIIMDYQRRLDDCADFIQNESKIVNKDPLLNQVEDLRSKYRSPRDIPQIITPTENGWHSLNENRIIEPSDNNLTYELIVTAANSNKIREQIRIIGAIGANREVIKFLNLGNKD
jgi:hypothetical protein